MESPEVILSLVILLVVLFGKRLPLVSRRLNESMKEWRWRSPSELEFRHASPAPPIWLQVGMVVFSVAGILTFSWLIDVEVLTVKEASAVAIVVAGWLVAGHYCFGRRS
jgi:hypothetical protein